MAYVRTVKEGSATGEVARTYKAIRNHLGTLPGVFKLMSADPSVLRDSWKAYPYSMEYGSLGRSERELVALAVSRANTCRYGVDGATHRLREMGMASPQITALFRADRQAQPDHLALIALAENATRHPGADLSRSVAAARAAGIGEQEIREAATVVVWFNALNRLVDGLGVPHDPPPRGKALQSLRLRARGLAARFRSTDSLPVVDAVQEGGAGETAIIILRHILDRLEVLVRRPPEPFSGWIRHEPRRISKESVDELRAEGLVDRAIFQAAFLAAGREALRRWDAVAPHLGDPLSGPQPPA